MRERGRVGVVVEFIGICERVIGCVSLLLIKCVSVNVLMDDFELRLEYKYFFPLLSSLSSIHLFHAT